MKLPPLDYICPATLPEAIAALAVHGGNAKVIAGGQSLMPMLAFRLAAPSVLVDIGRLPDLKSISISAEGIDIGALVTWRDIERDAQLAQAHPLLAAAIAHVAHYQVRNRGTVGGSMAHADPAAEMPGIAVTCDAMLTIVGSTGTRILSADEFLTGGLQHGSGGRRNLDQHTSAALEEGAALGLRGTRAPPRRFCAGGCCRILRHRRAGPGA